MLNMFTINVSITNAEQLRAAFDAAPGLMRNALKNAINKSLLAIGGQAAENAPVRTGNLRSSILDPQRGLTLANNSNFFSGSVGSGTNYGLYVELGTRFMRAQPYLQPAVNSMQDRVQNFFQTAVQGVLNDIGDMTRI